ncbi:MAG: 4a-hydroxytetrahydrobiopterin dehydratase [Anaerolineales bacterium]|nr:4a-hydroxytetrahydrobiopterin dehydratase [Anaerolineales bacterium]
MIDLKSMSCAPPRIGGAPLDNSDIETYLPQLPRWEVIEVDGEKRLTRQYKFNNFSAALKFTNNIGELAEQEDHHPAILTEWGRVTVTWWTHAVNGLHLNDFISAAKTDQIFTG